MSGARAPAMAMSAPTERSMPPVAITSVMPTATITMVQTWVRLTFSVCHVAKFGVIAKLTRRRSARASHDPWRVRNVFSSKRGAFCTGAGGRVVAVSAMGGLPISLMPMSHGGHHRSFAHGIALEFGHGMSVAQDEDAACSLHHLL